MGLVDVFFSVETQDSVPSFILKNILVWSVDPETVGLFKILFFPDRNESEGDPRPLEDFSLPALEPCHP